MSALAEVLAYRVQCVEAHRAALRWTLEHVAWCVAEGHDRHAEHARGKVREHARMASAARRHLREAQAIERELVLF